MLRMSSRRFQAWLLPVLSGLCAATATAEVLVPPGDLRVRHDIDLLNDSRVIDVAATAWPISWGEIHTALRSADQTTLTPNQIAAYDRLLSQSRYGLESDFLTVNVRAAVGQRLRFIRTFENTPRDERELTAQLTWVGERFTVNIQGTLVDDSFDGDEFRPDGTYIGVALGNWMLTAGWQERWWGPGRDGSLILGTNHRPAPGITLQRNNSIPFETRWLSWMGPWTFTTFMQHLDDSRVVDDALLFGVRGTIKPIKGLEISLSRTAQWCGEDRPCRLETFGDLLLGRDNVGVNVDADDEPGNQLGGIDIRWSLPKGIPVTAYMQWIGEDGRQGGGAIGSWLRQLGLEFYGTAGGVSHRVHFEVSDTECRAGGFGFSEREPNCAYVHPIYNSGYQYNGKAIGHGMDGDGLSYSAGITLVQSAGHVWNISLRHMELNRQGSPQPNHSVSPTASDQSDIQITYERQSRFGRFTLGAGYVDIDDRVNGVATSDTSLFVQWQSR